MCSSSLRKYSCLYTRWWIYREREREREREINRKKRALTFENFIRACLSLKTCLYKLKCTNRGKEGRGRRGEGREGRKEREKKRGKGSGDILKMKRERSPIPELPHIAKKAGTCTNLTKRELLYRYMYAHLLLTAWNKIAWKKSWEGKREERK